MHFCLFLFYFAFLLTPVVADDAVWNCHQDKNSKEWACTGEQAAPAAQAAPEPAQAAPAEIQETEVGVAAPTAPAAIPETEIKAAEKTLPPASPVESGETAIGKSEPAAPDAEASETAETVPPADLKETEIGASAPAAIAESTVKAAAKTVSAAVREKRIEVKPTLRNTPTSDEKLRNQDMRDAGWHCKTKEGEQEWDCNLTGPDPKGKARIVSAQESGFTLLDPAFNTTEEQVFDALVSELKYDPWAKCSLGPNTQPEFTPRRQLRDKSPLNVNADYGEVFDNEVSSYRGNVEVSRADQHSLSNAAQYDSVSQALDLQGEVYYSEDNLAVYSNSANLKLAKDQATLRNVQFITPSAPLRGRAAAAYRESSTLSRYKNVAYTSCPPGNRDWVVHASDLKVNDATGKGAAKNAWIEFKGAPVFYSPYLSFPIDNRRLSGFLAPSFGKTGRSGYDFSAPYYWNIAPYADATLKPRYLTERGMMLAGDLRLMTPYTNSKLGVEFLPHDEVRSSQRFLGSFKNTSQFGSHVHSNVDLNYVSDKEYFGELGNALSFPNFSHIKSTGDLGYTDIGKGISLVGRFENYQTIDKTLSGFNRPYRRLPQINLDLDHAFDFMPLNVALDGEYVYFSHDDLVNGQRLNIKPSVSSPLHNQWGYVTPKIALQHTDYQLNEKNVPLQSTNPSRNYPEGLFRTLPIVSVDSGLTLERELGASGSGLKHTIEPRLFYLYVPKLNQQNIPLFDTARYDLWFNNLFRDNAYSGIDRYQDANQVTAALTTRLIDPKTGLERLKLNVGQIYYFRNREVTAPIRIRNLPDYVQNTLPQEGLQTPTETDSMSPLIAELSGQFSDHWSAETGIQWNPRSNDIVRGKAMLHYTDESDKILNVGFNYRRDDLVERTLLNNPSFLKTKIPDTSPTEYYPYNPLEDSSVLRGNDLIQSDISFRWPILNQWYAVGRWQYSWLYNNTQESFVGVEKENCCWRFRLIGRRYVNNFNTVVGASTQLAEATSQTGVFFQVELKGLTGLGEKLDKFFEQSIFGYRIPD